MATIPAKDPEVTRKGLAAIQEQRQREAALAAKRRELWGALNHFVHVHGGWLTSGPHERWLRIETRDGSDLPAKLCGLGYDLHPGGVTERIEGGIIMPVQVFKFQISPSGK